MNRVCVSLFFKRIFFLFCSSENPEPEVMVAKPKLYYFRGRGRMESICWLLAAGCSWSGGRLLGWKRKVGDLDETEMVILFLLQNSWWFLQVAPTLSLSTVFLCKRWRTDHSPPFKKGCEGGSLGRCFGSFMGPGKILVDHKTKEREGTHIWIILSIETNWFPGVFPILP